MKRVILITILLLGAITSAQVPVEQPDQDLSQELNTEVLSLSEYLGYVKSFHPVVKQANLVINEGEAELLKARGAFDPKLEVDMERKEFKSTDYYDKLNAAFKIPTWYGVEFKAKYEENSGVFLNPESTVPEDGLYSVGVSVSLAQGLLTNRRMAMLKQARLFNKQVQADRQLMVNDILFEAAQTYFKWLKTYNDKQVYDSFLYNAEFRLEGIIKSYEAGEYPAVDTLEAGIIVQTRRLAYENARMTHVKASLELATFLWLDDNTPIELRDNVVPDTNTEVIIDEALNTSGINLDMLDIENHPKLISLGYKYEGLMVEKRLKANNLLPRVDLEYNLYSETPGYIDSYNTSNYMAGLNVNFPLFLRKERGDLKLAKAKVQSAEFEIAATRVSLRNKIDAISQEMESYLLQNAMTENMVRDYETLLRAEERKFFLGESFLFLINSRESKLIEARLKANETENKYFNSKARLFNTLGYLGVSS
jgi:outer membrane protein TolC